MAERGLRDRRVLVVEDEYHLAAELEEELGAAGAVVVGPAASVEDALALIEGDPALDGAMLDVNLGGEPVYPVADALMARGVPFVLTTGYDGRDIPALYTAAPRVGKPAQPCAFVTALARALEAT